MKGFPVPMNSNFDEFNISFIVSISVKVPCNMTGMSIASIKASMSARKSLLLFSSYMLDVVRPVI